MTKLSTDKVVAILELADADAEARHDWEDGFVPDDLDANWARAVAVLDEPERSDLLLISLMNAGLVEGALVRLAPAQARHRSSRLYAYAGLTDEGRALAIAGRTGSPIRCRGRLPLSVARPTVQTGDHGAGRAWSSNHTVLPSASEVTPHRSDTSSTMLSPNPPGTDGSVFGVWTRGPELGSFTSTRTCSSLFVMATDAGSA